jgi:pimeloyl-ACP methyl ester carboxylesterase
MEAATVEAMKISSNLHERSVSANGIRLRVLDSAASDKPPLLLLHGLYDRAECWQPVAEALSEHARLIMPDLRGHYRSDGPDSGYALRDYANDAIGLLEALEIEQADVLGHSLGALIAMELATVAPERVRRVVLEDPPSERDDHTRTWLGALLSAKRYTAEQTYIALHGIHPGRSEEELRRETEWLRATADGPFLALMELCGMDGDRFAETLGRLSHQILLLQADPRHGGALSVVAAREATTTHGRCRLVQFHDTGHTIHRERPDEFVAEVAEFLTAS